MPPDRCLAVLSALRLRWPTRRTSGGGACNWPSAICIVHCCFYLRFSRRHCCIYAAKVALHIYRCHILFLFRAIISATLNGCAPAATRPHDYSSMELSTCRGLFIYLFSFICAHCTERGGAPKSALVC